MITEKTQITQWIDTSRFSCPQFGTWLIGHEPNTQDPALYAAAELKVLIVRLSQYQYVAASMAHGLLGQLTAAVPDVYADYAFMPPAREAEMMRAAGIPPLFGTTSRECYKAFDILAVSNALAQELLNLSYLLSASGISLSFTERMQQADLPLVILGGANALSAFVACPDLVDALYLGEAEVSWQAILRYIKNAKRQKESKAGILKGLTETFPALYSPAAAPGRKTQRACLPALAGTPSLVNNPVWYNAETAGYASIAIDRGCPFLCYFCMDAWERRPYRQRPVQEVLADLDTAKKQQGLATVNFFSSNFSSYREGACLLRKAAAKTGNVAVKSQRFDTASDMQGIGKNSYTFGLEGSSGRLRNFLGKNITAEQVLAGLQRIYTGPVRQVKIFLIVTGHEEQRDLDELEKLLKQIGALQHRSSLILSLTPFMPMPHTPLQFHPFPDPLQVKQAVNRIVSLGTGLGHVVRESICVEEARLVHYLNFASTEQVGTLIDSAARYRYHKVFNPALWKEIEQHTPPRFLAWLQNEKSVSDVFPWDQVIVKSETEKVFLYKHYRKAMAALQVAAPEPHPVRTIPPAACKPLPAAGTPLVTTLWFRIRVGQELAGVPAAFFPAALARALCLADTGLCRAYLQPGAAWRLTDKLPLYGQAVFSLLFDSRQLPAVLQTVTAALPALPGSWGWDVQAAGAPAPGTQHTPEGFRILYTGIPQPAEKEIWRFTDRLKAGSIKHLVRNYGTCKVIAIDASSINLVQCLYITIDLTRNTLLFSLKLSDKDQTCLGFLKKTPFEYLLQTPARVLDFWYKDRETKCPGCRNALYRDAFSGTVLTDTPCNYFC